MRVSLNSPCAYLSQRLSAAPGEMRAGAWAGGATLPPPRPWCVHPSGQLPPPCPGARAKVCALRQILPEKQPGEALCPPTRSTPDLKENIRPWLFKDPIRLNPPNPGTGFISRNKCLKLFISRKMPGAFPQDVDGGSKRVEHDSSVQGASQWLPPGAGTGAGSARQERPPRF